MLLLCKSLNHIKYWSPTFVRHNIKVTTSPRKCRQRSRAAMGRNATIPSTRVWGTLPWMLLLRAPRYPLGTISMSHLYSKAAATWVCFLLCLYCPAASLQPLTGWKAISEAANCSGIIAETPHDSGNKNNYIAGFPVSTGIANPHVSKKRKAALIYVPTMFLILQSTANFQS